MKRLLFESVADRLFVVLWGCAVVPPGRAGQI